MTDTANNDFPRKLRKCHNIADLRLAAKSALPYPIFDHVDGGSDDEVTLSANTSAFGKYSLKPRYCSGVEAVDASTTVLGQRIEWPFFVGPAGGLKYLHRDGEIGAARAAHKYGTAFAMSGWTNTRPEDIVAASDGPRFFQLQPCRSREVMADMIQLARDTGYNALIVTVDNPYSRQSGARCPQRFWRATRIYPEGLGIDSEQTALGLWHRPHARLWPVRQIHELTGKGYGVAGQPVDHQYHLGRPGLDAPAVGRPLRR